jgi:hypothetical protein
MFTSYQDRHKKKNTAPPGYHKQQVYSINATPLFFGHSYI